MITIKRVKTDIERVKLLDWFIATDTKKWVIAEETGNFGYKHWQIRMSSRYDFKTLQAIFGKNAHIEECSDTWDYERKEGKYITSWDTIENLQTRFGVLRPAQARVLALADLQNDREITVWYDQKGAIGKTWLGKHLYQTGKGFFCPPTIHTAQGYIQWVSSGYNGEKYIIIDIPRNQKWTNELYIAVETIKDGLVYDARYSSKVKDISGAKVIVLTNNMPKLDKLSVDRWQILGEGGEPLT